MSKPWSLPLTWQATSTTTGFLPSTSYPPLPTPQNGPAAPTTAQDSLASFLDPSTASSEYGIRAPTSSPPANLTPHPSKPSNSSLPPKSSHPAPTAHSVSGTTSMPHNQASKALLPLLSNSTATKHPSTPWTCTHPPRASSQPPPTTPSASGPPRSPRTQPHRKTSCPRHPTNAASCPSIASPAPNAALSAYSPSTPHKSPT